MRLISQNGMIDVPYENVIIACENNRDGKYTIYARCSHCLGMATYSTEDKALKVMEMLREAYVNNEYYKSLCSGIVIPLPNNSDDMKEKMVATRTFRATTIFHFPDDSDVEV